MGMGKELITIDDLISRKAIMNEAKRISGPMTGDGWDNWGVYALIERQPSIDAIPVVHGKWVKETDRFYHWHCSECQQVWGFIAKFMKYCPNCGAKMEMEDIDNG